ncbi:MAG: FRG domain-containing protein [Deltaproteobacteria bacterium]|nr:FRG domain-containing protein [Deltaproteobacteria bacterium]
MQERKLNSWLEFEKEIDKLEAQRARLAHEYNNYVSPLLFRGQADSSWELESTLERYTSRQETPALHYFRIVERVRPQVETYTGKRWGVEWSHLQTWSDEGDLMFLESFPAPEYMIYLRHHGFPSPLLDWTKSPFIAAFFAFNDIPPKTPEVAVYAYIEWAGRGKSQDADNPVISSMRARIPSHKRHFLQQSEYTICAANTKSGVVFSSYSKAFSVTDTGENLLWKFTLPSSDRLKVLRKLDQMNINSLSLFENEESLMSTVALRAFCIENADKSGSR